MRVALARRVSDRWHWGLPVALFLALSVLALVLWRFELWDERNKIESLMNILAQQLALRLEHGLEEHVGPLWQLRRASGAGGIQSAEAFDHAAHSILEQFPAYECVGRIDATGVCDAAASAGPSQELLGRDLSGLSPWDQLLRSGRENGRPGAAAVRDSDGRCLLCIMIPLLVSEKGQTQTSAIVVRSRLRTIIETSIDADARGKLFLRLDSVDGPIYENGEGGMAHFEAVAPIEFLGQSWQLRARPRSAFVSQTMGHSPQWVLWGGLLAAALVALVAFQALGYRAAYSLRTRRHLEALESLNEISAAISSKLGSDKEVLTQLAEAARELLKMDRAGVSILHPQNQVLEILAAAGDMPASYPRFFPLARTPASKRCIEQNEMIFVEDARKLDMPFNPEVASLFHAGCFILIPLRAHGQMGLMTLARSRPCVLSALDRRLAQLWGAQASVILANNCLYQQMSEALQTRDVLLRELNHRVKNNLAGIVSLLSIGKPQLPAEAEAWLDRAVDRIRTMAGAHELFSGGMQTVGLRQLLDQVLSSVAVVRPSTVSVRVDAPTTDIQLSTDQAVSLVMVLHELCYNALVHGLRGAGTLTVRAAIVEPHSLAIEIMDDGCGLGTSAPPADGPSTTMAGSGRASTGTGLGLELVRGLVSRELRGQFSLSRRPAGEIHGTVATVVFPLAGEKLQDNP